jgi:hypothetical protein
MLIMNTFYIELIYHYSQDLVINAYIDMRLKLVYIHREDWNNILGYIVIERGSMDFIV